MVRASGHVHTWLFRFQSSCLKSCTGCGAAGNGYAAEPFQNIFVRLRKLPLAVPELDVV